MSEGATHVAVARARGGSAAPTAPRLDPAVVRAALAEVPDPEIPGVTIVDLGMVEDLAVDEHGIRVTLLPTFIGCPALDLIRSAVEDRLDVFPLPVTVRFEFATPWTSDRITAQGRARLLASGFAPPGPDRPGSSLLIQLQTPVPCPNCGSIRTTLIAPFGPTQCRSIRHCAACRQPFESFKTI